jgi:hypothetical protein
MNVLTGLCRRQPGLSLGARSGNNIIAIAWQDQKPLDQMIILLNGKTDKDGEIKPPNLEGFAI